MKELYKDIESNGLSVECWYRGLKNYSISKLSTKDNSIFIKMNNDDSILIKEIDGNIEVRINKQLKYKNTNLDYSWLKEIYRDYLKNKGVKFI